MSKWTEFVHYGDEVDATAAAVMMVMMTMTN
jgi:hypothetical protein